MCFPPTPSFPLSAAEVNTNRDYPALLPALIQIRDSSVEQRRARGLRLQTPGGGFAQRGGLELAVTQALHLRRTFE